MTENRAYEARTERLLAELATAEAELGQASTAASRRRCRDRYDRALARYSELMLRQPLSGSARDSGR